MKRPALLVLLTAAFIMLWPAGAQAATEYVEGEVIVTFKPEATEGRARAALNRKSLTFARRYDWLSQKRGRQTGLVRRSNRSTAELIAELKDDPEVESVEPNYLRWVNALPNDSRFGELWGLRNTGQSVDGTKGTAGADVKFVEAWNMARLSSDEIVVGVIDTGVNYGHPDLAANMWVNPGEILNNSNDDDGDGYVDDYHGYDFSDRKSDPGDVDSHGTHVAGTIAAVGHNASGVIGVNHRAKVMALKVSSNGDSISTSAVIEAIQYATMMKGRGVNVVALNASYGGGGFSNSERAAILAAGNAGIILVAAAGNDSKNNDTSTTYPASYRLFNMIVVAASDQKDALASFSNYGATKVDLAAPGTKILSTQPADLALKVGNTTYSSSAMTFSGTTPGLSGKIYDCGIGNPANFPPEVNGNIALIERGTLTFAEKAANAMAAGAVAVIIYNNVTGSFAGTLGAPGNWVPTRSISRADGLSIKSATPANASLSISAGFQFMQGTSMATPHVTGAVAFAAMNFPAETVTQRIQRILGSVDAKSGLTGKVATGGRLNLQRTVDANANNIADWLEPTGTNPPVVATAATLPSGAVSMAYSQSLTATGGKAPYSWTLISGSLPAGLTLSSAGVIHGTPTTPGVVTFAARVKDAANASSAQVFDLTISSTPLAVSSPATLPPGKVGTVYTNALAAIGGMPGYAWSVSSGALPQGLALSASGLLSGVPSIPGTFTFVARVTDGSQVAAERSMTLQIEALPLNITTASALPVGALTLAYSKNLAVTGGTAPHHWSISSGALPAGLNLSSQGLLSGIPTTFGSFNFTARVTDGASETLSKAFVLVVEETPVTITTEATLLAGVKSLAYAKTFSAAGGNGSYLWSLSGGLLPPGMKLSHAGILSGTPTVAGVFDFAVTAADGLGLAVSQVFQLSISATYSRPILSPIDLGATTVGVPYNYTVTAANYPKTYTIRNLPPGLKYAAATGVISGRPTVPGTFDVEIKAANPAGSSDVEIAPLTVHALPEGFVGSFTGIIARDPSGNRNLGSRLALTTTKAGAFTAKITTGRSTQSIKGYLSDATPHIQATVGGSLLSLEFGGGTQIVSGSHGPAAVTGWRAAWNSANPATSRKGYYTVGIDLARPEDDGIATIPQGSGYASFTVSAAGTLTVVGRASDGVAFTSGGFLGSEGNIAVYSSLYGNLGSLAGVLGLTEDPNAAYLDNTVSGSLSWLKPPSSTRVYAAGFGPLDLKVFGKYLAPSANHGIVAGLPDTGLVSLRFADGGLAESEIDPDVASISYTPAKTLMPAAGGIDNPARAALSLNKYRGSLKGSFTLVETDPKLTRRVTFFGLIIRPAAGNSKAAGYFLLPQIPSEGQKAAASPILSGKIVIEQTPTAE